jgi:hypothetical protein
MLSPITDLNIYQPSIQQKYLVLRMWILYTQYSIPSIGKFSAVALADYITTTFRTLSPLTCINGRREDRKNFLSMSLSEICCFIEVLGRILKCRLQINVNSQISFIRNTRFSVPMKSLHVAD